MPWTNRERRHVSSTLQGVSDRKQELESSKKFLREGGSCWMRVWRTQQHKGTLASIHSTVTEVNKFWLLCSRGRKQAWEGTAGLRDAGWDMGQAKGDRQVAPQQWTMGIWEWLWLWDSAPHPHLTCALGWQLTFSGLKPWEMAHISWASWGARKV